jgi:hypothetical protein
MGASRFLTLPCKHNGLTSYHMHSMGLFGLLFASVMLSATVLPRWETGFWLSLAPVLYSPLQTLFFTVRLFAGFSLSLMPPLLSGFRSNVLPSEAFTASFLLNQPFCKTVVLGFSSAGTITSSGALSTFKQGVFQRCAVKEAWM